MSTTTTSAAEQSPGIELRDPDSPSAVIENTRALLPLVAEEADGIEDAARLTPRALTAMRRAGVFEMGFPAFRGGLEMTLSQQVEVVAAVAAVDASAGWNIGVLNAGGYYAGRLGDRAYAELYPTRDMPTSGSFHPRGRAEIVDGGFLVTGAWDWGSGSYSAEHIVGGALVFDGDTPAPGPDGKQRHLGLWLPREAVEPAHNWQTLGVRGSGSTSYAITTPVFVPADHSFDREAPYDHTKDPLNRSVKLSHFALTGVVLGVARHLVNLTADTVRGRLGDGGAARLDTATAQALGAAMGEVDFAYAGVRETARITDDIIFSDDVLTPVHEDRMTAANAVAALGLRRVVDLCTELAGARYILDTSPLQRVLRDAYGALAHAGTRRMHLGTLARTALTHPATGLTVPDDTARGGGVRDRCAS
ncbi:acyl-CoA dehydrogenase family protein [Streptomyces sp. NPDC047000]|uniref:acyl-CoA dehydrogenase family protein n=1 Tax=Streptomyces sp. NPDC047000 TaxID=3155474 RepID=UPI0033E5B246